MRTVLRTAIAAIPLLFGLMLLPGAIASAAGPPGAHWPGGRNYGHHPPHGFFKGPTYNCTSGTIPPGSYGNVLVTGVCYMKVGNVTVWGNVTVAPGALLDAVTKGDPMTSPVVPATVNIRGNVNVGHGAVLVFGCSPNITCGPPTPPGITYDHIGGNLTAFGAEAVVIHSASIGGSVTEIGGGSIGAEEECSPTAHLTSPPTVAPWSEDTGINFFPPYTDSEDVTVGGNYVISGVTSCWMGTIRVQIRGSAVFTNNTMGDPDAMELLNNLVRGNLICLANSPAVGFHDSAASPNIVGGFGVGECGFGVTQPNPFHYVTTTVTPHVTVPAGPTEHVAVSMSSLQTFAGTYTSTTTTLHTITTTESHDHIFAVVSDFKIAGSGLTCSATVTSGLRLGAAGNVAPGSALLATQYPNGTESFTVYMYAHCSFEGKSGTVKLRAYGTTQRNGYTSGTFFVTSGGSGSPASHWAPSMATLDMLAGWGTFTNAGEPTGTVRLVEHLANT
jgi:hypothetical protein